ncbi:hypothetical protein RFI_31353 [Reticulomyxa filosa]|uniref:Transmembrane protein n=1 Tax=Reticulomyxa filosa TaxID=46433 RepID=X6LVT2_RETFI|nr:hypothetical protein RFI_31353 [Reticulomyxa filosa]|eukprot:ETO06043.1 hypothetical protein RFI_31353 [Reticulomyxa filosa]
MITKVPYLTLLHKYVIISFLFISCVSIQSALLSVTVVSWFSSPWFDKICGIVFACVFVFYNLCFWILSAWKRHDESRKLYLDSDQLAELVEKQKKQFQIQWSSDPMSKDIFWCGNNGRIAAFGLFPFFCLFFQNVCNSILTK